MIGLRYGAMSPEALYFKGPGNRRVVIPHFTGAQMHKLEDREKRKTKKENSLLKIALAVGFGYALSRLI